MTPPDSVLAVWTCDDVAAYLKVSRRKVDYLRKQDDFPKSVALGGAGHPRFSASQVIRWFEAQTAAA